jgi:WD40 repeat protein
MVNSGSNVFHINLACYFASKPLYLDGENFKKPNIRKLIEQPWQELEAAKITEQLSEKYPKKKGQREKLWDNVTNTLCNLDFIQAKAAAKMTYELVEDFNAALQKVPENKEYIREEQKRKARINKYTRDLISCSKGEICIEEVEIPITIIPYSTDQENTENERIKKKPNRADRLNAFHSFLGHESINLNQYSSQFLNYATQQAWNFACDFLAKAARDEFPKKHKNLLCRSMDNQYVFNPKHFSIKTLNLHSWYVFSVSITANGEEAISGSWDESCIVWNLKTGRPINILNGHKGMINAVAITPDGKRAISGSWDQTCILWDVKIGKPIFILNGHNGKINSVAITPDGNVAISSSDDNTCVIWDLINGLPNRLLIGHKSPVQAISISKDGFFAFGGCLDGTCIYWNLKTGKIIHSLKSHSNLVSCVDLSLKRNIAISGSRDNTCIVWDLINGKKIKALEGHCRWVNSVSITPDEKWAVSGSTDKTIILWNLYNGEKFMFWKHAASVNSVSITPDAHYIISGSEDYSCCVWNLLSKKALPYKDNLNESIIIQSLPNITFAPKYLLTPDQNRKFELNHNSDCIFINTNNSKILHDFKLNHPINYERFCPNGRFIITKSAKSNLILWDLEHRTMKFSLNGHTNDVLSVSYSPDGRFAVTCGKDNTCLIWDLNSGFIVKKLQKHKFWIHDIAFAPDGKVIISGSADKSCIIWDWRHHESFRVLKGHKTYINTIFVTHDGKQFISGSDDDCFIKWDICSGEMLSFVNSSLIKDEAGLFPKAISELNSFLNRAC